MAQNKKLFVWPEQELVGCRRSGASKGHVENGCLYTVLKTDKDTVTVQLSLSMTPDDAPRPEIVLTDYEAGQLLRYAHARTVAGRQGLTFANKRVLLLPVHTRRAFSRRPLQEARWNPSILAAA